MTTPLAPVWTTPSAAGLLSNKRGSNTGADALTPTVKYSNPGGLGDPAGTVRVTASRLLAGGVGEAAEPTWDSGWVGNPTLSNLSSLNGGAVHGTTFVYNGRVYAASRANTGQVMSASITGASVGSWRNEPSPAATVYVNNYLCSLQWIQSMTTVGGYVYALCKYIFAGGNTDRLMVAAINPDGTLGPFRFALWNGQMSGTYASQIIGVQDTRQPGNPIFLMQIGGSDASGSAATTTCFIVRIDPTSGDFVDFGASQTALPANRKLHGVIYVPFSNTLWVIGGDDGVGAQSTVYRCNPTLTLAAYASATAGSGTAVVSAWTTDTALPAVRTGAAVVYAPLAGSNGGAIYVIGGSATLVASGAVSTIYSNQAYNAGAVLPAWSTQVNGLDVAKWLLGAVVSDSQQFTSGTNVGNPLIVLGGVSAAAANLATVLAMPITQSTGATLVNVTGQGAALATANMGTNGSVANNADGTQAVTFSYLGFGGPAGTRTGGGFSDGDVVQLGIQFTDQLTGLPSPTTYTLIKIGQPPTLTGLVATANGGRPVVTWNYIPGAGGASQASWRLQTTGYDSGTVAGAANSATPLEAPLLANGVQVTLTATVTSSDSPMPGSTNTATATLNYTPAYAAPAQPTTVGAVPNNAGGYITVSWTHPGGSTATQSRIYYRINGAATWYLLMDAIATAGAGNYSQVVADEVPAGVGLDFAVSALTATGESALSAAVTNVKIDLTAGGYNAILHVAGLVQTYAAPVRFVPTSHIDYQEDVATILPFGSAAPAVRYGVAGYHRITGRAYVKTTAALKALQAVIAQARLGNTVYYRDANGTLYTVAFDPKLSIEYAMVPYRWVDLALTEVPDTYQPSVALGSAIGYRSQSAGTLVPLDTSYAGL